MDCDIEVNPKPVFTSRFDAGRIETPAILLVGGKGTRLQTVLPSTPKPLAPIGDVTFLHLLLMQLRSQGIHRVVMCTGHLANQIEEGFGDGHELDMEIEYSRESSPLGTAGAIKHAERYIGHESEFLALNGDSFLQIDFDRLMTFHRKHRGLISMAVREVPDAARFGTVQAENDGRVTGFKEKTGVSKPGIVNGGVYVFSHEIFECIPSGQVSLEMDVIPHLLERGVYALEQVGLFIDIGTPEDYARAQTVCRNLYPDFSSQ